MSETGVGPIFVQGQLAEARHPGTTNGILVITRLPEEEIKLSGEVIVELTGKSETTMDHGF